MEAHAFPDDVHDHHLVLWVAGLRLPNVQVCQGVPHLVDALPAAKVLDEVVLLLLGHRHRDLAVVVHERHARVELEIAPHLRAPKLITVNATERL
eukprot:2126690-Heterocapsa_arctica.AAC.1